MTVGIIGGTGSSKSTFVQMIPRLYDATEGFVSVGGIDVRDYDLESLRDGVAMVLQRSELGGFEVVSQIPSLHPSSYLPTRGWRF